MTAADHDTHSYVDPARTACLGNGYHAAVCVTAHGVATYWIVATGPDDGQGCTCPDCAPHEQTGPLPYTWHARVREHRCGRPRRDGGRCRTPVAHPGDACTWHRAAGRDTERAHAREEG